MKTMIGLMKWKNTYLRDEIWLWSGHNSSFHSSATLVFSESLPKNNSPQG